MARVIQIKRTTRRKKVVKRKTYAKANSKRTKRA